MFEPRARRRPGFGIALPNLGKIATSENVFAVAERAEALGYDDVWVNDHLSVTGRRFGGERTEDPNFLECMTVLAAVAGRCSSIGVAVHSFLLAIRDPRLAAKQLATLDLLSDGRLTIAPGIGSSQDDFAALGVDFTMRGRLMNEHLRVLDAIFHGEEPLDFDGKYVHLKGGVFYPRPRRIEMWITGDAEPGLARVVRWGTGWFSSAWPTFEDYVRLNARLDELLAEAGRDPATLERASDPFVCVARTHEEALALTSTNARAATRGVILARGDPDEVKEHLAKFLRAGATYLELRLIARDGSELLEMMELLATEVLPEVAARSATAS